MTVDKIMIIFTDNTIVHGHFCVQTTFGQQSTTTDRTKLFGNNRPIDKLLLLSYTKSTELRQSRTIEILQRLLT